LLRNSRNSFVASSVVGVHIFANETDSGSCRTELAGCTNRDCWLIRALSLG